MASAWSVVRTLAGCGTRYHIHIQSSHLAVGSFKSRYMVRYGLVRQHNNRRQTLRTIFQVFQWSIYC